MFTCVFIDFENLEKTVKQVFGSVLDYDQLVRVIRASGSAGNPIVGIFAYGDFDRGEAGLQTRLTRLGIEPRHVVTKTPHEYLKGSTDIELSLDILQTMYDYPHITDFMLLTGDGDLTHVARRLRMRGKTVHVMGFREHTSKLLLQSVSSFVALDDHREIMRKVTLSDKERKAAALVNDPCARQVIRHLDDCERNLDKAFIGLSYLRRRLVDRFPEADISDALTQVLDAGLIETYHVDNPEDPAHPTKACRLAANRPEVRRMLQD